MSNQTVHILATLRNEKMLHATLLVFKTLRIGFPKAHVVVWGNGLSDSQCVMMQQVAAGVNADFRNVTRRTHGQWIEALVLNATQPFWICDTDIVFMKEMKMRLVTSSPTLFSGRYEPEFVEEWTKTVHVARLHPSLMWFNPCALRAAMRMWPGLDEFFGTVKRELFEWQFVPVTALCERRGRRSQTAATKRVVHFYDTCAALHHAVGGTPFTEAQNECFEHLHCGTYADLISPHLSVDNLLETHRAIFQQPEIARGMRAEQEKYYAGRKPKVRDSSPRLLRK